MTRADGSADQDATALLADAVAAGLFVLSPWDRQRFLVAFDQSVAAVLRQSRATGGGIPPELEASVTQLTGSIHFHLARLESEIGQIR